MVLDITCFLFAAYGFYLGFSKGIIGTFFTIVSLTIGIVAAFKFTPATTKFLETVSGNTNPLWFVAGLALSFFIVMILLRMISKTIEGLLESANINVVNQFLGGVILSAIFILIFSVLVWFGDQGKMIDRNTKVTSITYPYLEQYPVHVKDVAYRFKPMFLDFWNQSMTMMDRLEKISIEQTEQIDIEDRSDELPAEE